MNKYRINIHAHSIFSDGYNSPYVMALKAKELGFTALVITDHWYGCIENSLTPERVTTLRKSANEARKIIPVIIGLEIPVLGQEVLVFGGDAVKEIAGCKNKVLANDLFRIKNSTSSAFILCHPGIDISNQLVELIDGFEAYNSGRNYFDKRGFGSLAELPAWSGSDAHMADYLSDGWNEVDTKITTEDDLIKYIKSGKQPDLFAKGKVVAG